MIFVQAMSYTTSAGCAADYNDYYNDEVIINYNIHESPCLDGSTNATYAELVDIKV